jgi:DNA-binding MarR family transcriptional regulator
MNMRPKVAELPPGPAKAMDKMITAVAKGIAERFGYPLADAKRAVTELIDKGLARIHVEGMPPMIEVTLVLTEEGVNAKTILEDSDDTGSHTKN